MKTAKELYDEWTSGEQNGMRPKRVQALRDDFREVLDMAIPARVSQIEGWLDTMKSSGVITRKLKAAAEGSDEEAEPPEEESDPPPEDRSDDE